MDALADDGETHVGCEIYELLPPAARAEDRRRGCALDVPVGFAGGPREGLDLTRRAGLVQEAARLGLDPGGDSGRADTFTPRS
jgi:hypothetical protein